MRLGIAGLQKEGPLEMPDGLGRPAERKQRIAEAVLGLRGAGAQAQGLLVLGDRLPRSAEGPQGVAKVAVRARVAGPDPHRPFVARGRVLKAPRQGLQSAPQVVLGPVVHRDRGHRVGPYRLRAPVGSVSLPGAPEETGGKEKADGQAARGSHR